MIIIIITTGIIIVVVVIIIITKRLDYTIIIARLFKRESFAVSGASVFFFLFFSSCCFCWLLLTSLNWWCIVKFRKRLTTRPAVGHLQFGLPKTLQQDKLRSLILKFSRKFSLHKEPSKYVWKTASNNLNAPSPKLGTLIPPFFSGHMLWCW